MISKSLHYKHNLKIYKRRYVIEISLNLCANIKTEKQIVLFFMYAIYMYIFPNLRPVWFIDAADIQLLILLSYRYALSAFMNIIIRLVFIITLPTSSTSFEGQHQYLNIIFIYKFYSRYHSLHEEVLLDMSQI